MPPEGSSPNESRASDSPDEPTDHAPDEPTGADSAAGPSDETVVQAAADAAEGVIFSRYARSGVRDYDVTVTFEDGVLEVDVYLNAPDAEGPDEDRVADDAALAGRAAVDDLFGE